MRKIYFVIIFLILKTVTANALGDVTSSCITYLQTTYNVFVGGSKAPTIVDSTSSPGYTRVIVPVTLFTKNADGTPAGHFGVSACTSEFGNPSLPQSLDAMSARNDQNRIASACGSEIDYQSKIVSESIPVDGTDIYLNYSSRYNTKTNKNRTIDTDYALSDRSISDLRVRLFPANVTEPILLSMSAAYGAKANVRYITKGQGLTYSDPFKSIYDFSLYIERIFAAGVNLPLCEPDLNNVIVCNYALSVGYYPVVSEQKTLVVYKPSAFGLKGWTVSSHHFFDRGSKTLFLGSGNTVSYRGFKTATLAPYGSVDILINQTNSNELFIFNQQGVHLETRHAIMKTLISKFNYLPSNYLSSIENKYGQTINFHYNAQNNIEKITSNYGVQTLISADSLKINSVTDSLSHLFEMQYDANDLLTSFKNINGLVTTFTYDSEGNFQKEEKNNGLIQLFYTDYLAGVKFYIHKLGFGDSESVSSDVFDNKITTRKYNENKDLVYQKETLILNNRYKTIAQETTSEDSYTADSMWGQDYSGTMSTGNYIVTADEAITSTISRQDTRFYQNSTNPLTIVEQATSVSEPSINRSITGSLKFSPATVLTEVDSVLGPTTTTFNAHGLPTKIEPYSQYATDIEYDSFGRISKVKKGNQDQTFGYDLNGYLSSSTDYKSQTTQYLRNVKGQVLEVTLPNSDKIKYEYDAGGTLKKLTTPSNQVHQFQRGLGDYLEGMLTPLSKQTLIEYDADKRVDKITKPSGKILDYVYKPASKDLDKVVTPEGELKVTTYDVLSRVRSIKSPDNIRLDMDWAGSAVKKQTWYDVDGSTIASLKFTYYTNQFRVKDIYLNSSKIATYTYNKGRVDGLQTDVYSQYSYPAAIHEENIGVVVGNRLFYSQSRIDNALGANPTDITKVSVSNSISAELELSMKRIYDSLGQASEFTSSTYNVNSHVYSNYFSLIPTYDQNNRLIKMEKLRKTYVNGVLTDSKDFYNKYLYPANSNNNMKEFTQFQNLNNPPIKRTTASHNTDDQLLEMKGSINRTYTYTDDGEMASMTNCFGTINYEYDSFSNLKKVTFPDGKIVEYKTDAMNRRVKKMVNGSVKEYYLWYDQQRLAAILDENKAPKLIYLYGPESGHSPSYLIKNNKTYKLVQDAGTGSIRYIVDPTNIYVVQELEYDEFGNIMRNSNPNYQPVLFAGGLYDEDTKLVKFGARDYDPTIGRWTTKDPIGFAGGDTNLYAYVGGNPMSYIDPTGLWGITIGLGAGGYLGGGYDLSGGIYFGSQNGSIFAGVYGSGSTGFGYGGGVGAQGTYYSDANSMCGSSVNYNSNLGPISGTVVTDSNTGAITGAGAGFGVGSSRGASMTFVYTGTFGFSFGNNRSFGSGTTPIPSP